NLEAVLPTTIPLQILDFQDENLSIIYYNNEAYQGNAYFYQQLEEAFSDIQIKVFRDFNQSFDQWLNQSFPVNGSIPLGILDFTTSLTSGLTYQRYNLSSDLADANNLGVILQTGKYLGDFPFEVEASLIDDEGQFWSVSNTIAPSEIVLGDTMMREMWYGPHLRDLEVLISNNEDRQYIIEQSIKERVLTGLTAFLALEPDQGGEPCIDCLLNNGTIFPVSIHEQFVPEDVELAVNPNPASEVARIRMAYPGVLNPKDWTASVFDASGRFICTLDLTRAEDNVLEWEWRIDASTKGGIYFCNIVSEFTKQVAKVVIVPR
ncbi:MAG: hypothetical protein AAF985_13395, partial [Bacteroidota bacterium]